MQALILAGGRGKRLGSHTETINKCMLPYKGKPIIEYSISNAVSANVVEIIIVVGYKAEDIIKKFGDSYKNVPVKYVFQEEQNGLVGAIECAKDVIKDDFILFLGDEILFSPDYNGFIKAHIERDDFVTCGVVEVKDINLVKKTYEIIEDKNKIIKINEKPLTPANNLMGTGNCIFKKEIFNYIDKTPVNPIRGEKELASLIQCAIDDDQIVRPFIISDSYINLNQKSDLEFEP